MDENSKKLVRLGVGFAVVIAVATLAMWHLDNQGAGAEGLAASDDPNQRRLAAERLRGKHGAGAKAILRKLSRDSDKWVAIKAVRAFGEDRSAETRDMLVEIAKDSTANANARGEAAATLGRHKDADPGLLTQMLIGDPSPEARAGAAKGLVRRRDPKTVPELVRALEDRDAQVRLWAITAIHKMIARRFPYNAKVPPEKQRQTIERIKAYLRACGVL